MPKALKAIKKIWIKDSIYALLIAIILLIKTTFNVFLLVLAGSLIAVFIRNILH